MHIYACLPSSKIYLKGPFLHQLYYIFLTKTLFLAGMTQE